MGAYSYSQLITIGTQLLGLPIFLKFWTLEEYGIWLMISVVPVYFAMSDLGIISLAGNKMTMAMANNDVDDANKIFQSAFLMLSCMVLIVLCVSVVFLYLIDYGFFANESYKLALLLLIVSCLLGLIGNLIDTVFRANNEFAISTYLLSTARLLEWVFTILAVYLYDNIVFAAIGYLSGRVLMTIFNISYTINRHRTFKWSFEHSSWSMIKNMLKPSIAFMAIPVSNAITLQGMTLLIGGIIGPASVVVFNAYRTLSRFLLQGALVINKPLWPEFSRLYGLKDFATISKYYFNSLFATIAAMVLGFIFLFFFSESIFQIWSAGKITIDGNVYFLLVLASCTAGINQVPTTLLSATNQHIQYFLVVLGISVVGIIVAYYTIGIYDIDAIAVTLLSSEIILLIICSTFIYCKFLLKNKDTTKSQNKVELK